MTAQRRVLVTVSGSIAPDLAATIASGRRPRADYIEMARAFDADLLDRPRALRDTGRVGRLIARVAGADVALAWACFRRRKRYATIFTDGEQVGLPLAALLWLSRRRPRHVMIGHVLTPRPKRLLHRTLRLQHRVDTVIVYASEQARFAVDVLGYRSDQVVRHPFMVDTDFWRPEHATAEQGPNTICAVGQELRDYATLVRAVHDLDVEVVIAAASPWSRRRDSSADLDLPPHVTVGAYDLHALRELYASSRVVVVPLEETDFQAGITTILEAMSMGRPVICTRTSGQTDTIEDGVTGRYVPAGDHSALRAAMVELLEDHDAAASLATAARSWVETYASIDRYVSDLAAIVNPDGRAPRTGAPLGPPGS